MNKPLLRIALAGALAASYGWAATITSGSVSQKMQNTIAALNEITLSGSNFSITFSDRGPGILAASEVGLPGFTSGSGFCLQPTCSYDFTKTASLVNGDFIAFLNALSVTYNGTTYTAAGGYSLGLTLAFTSSNATVPNTLGTYSGGLTANAVWSDVPFTALGSFTVFNGSSVVVTDSLTGSGLAGGNYSLCETCDFSYQGLEYDFAATPEPASAGLVGIGLVIALVLSHRQLQKRAS